MFIEVNILNKDEAEFETTIINITKITKIKPLHKEFYYRLDINGYRLCFEEKNASKKLQTKTVIFYEENGGEIYLYVDETYDKIKEKLYVDDYKSDKSIENDSELTAISTGITPPEIISGKGKKR